MTSKFVKTKPDISDQTKLKICVVKLQNFERLWNITVENIKLTVFSDMMPYRLVYNVSRSP
jgi:hypothetical protein